jgi:hypothetical protein
MRLINNRCGGRIRLNPRRKIMASNQTNTSQTGELTEAELDRVSGGNTSTTTTKTPTPPPTAQKLLEIELQDSLVSSY